MADLDQFLEESVEGYLIEDIKTLKAASPSEHPHYGGVGYPLLITTFAGIELLGNLLSTKAFDTNGGKERFEECWRDYVYPNHHDRQKAGPPLYQLARHGLANMFVMKADIQVVKGNPSLHLCQSQTGGLVVDAAQLADDFIDAYWSRIRPQLMGPHRDEAKRRLDAIESEYQKQAHAQLRKASILIMAATFGTTASGATRPAFGPNSPIVVPSASSVPRKPPEPGGGHTS